MDGFSTAISCVALLETLTKLAKLASKIKTAPEKWREYCTSLETLRMVTVVVNSVTHGMTGLSRLTINVNGEQKGLMEFCSANVNVAVNDAKSLLKKLEQAGNINFKNIKAWFKDKHRRFRFILQEGDIQGLIERVGSAKSTLEMAIALAILAKTNSGHSETQNSIQEMRDEMARQFLVLEERQKEAIKQRDGEPLQIHAVDGPFPQTSGLAPPAMHKRIPETFDGLASDLRMNQVIYEERQENASAGSTLPQIVDLFDAESIEHLTGIAAPDVLPAEVPVDDLLACCSRATPKENDETHGDDVKVVFHDDDGNANVVIVSSETRERHGDDNPESRLAIGRVERRLTEEFISSSSVIKSGDTLCPDAQDLVDYLKRPTLNQIVAHSKPTSAASINLPFEALFEFDMPDNSATNSEKVEILCIQRLENDLFSALVRCPRFPRCGHVKMKILGGGAAVEDLSKFDTAVFIFALTSQSGWQAIDAEHGLDTPLHRTCETPCTHTKVKEDKDSATMCMDSIYVLGLLRERPQYTSGDEFSNDEQDLEEDSEADTRPQYTSDDEFSNDEQDSEEDSEADTHRFSLPCFHCRKQALNPEPENGLTTALVLHGRHMYGYKCRDCKRMTWVVGLRDVDIDGLSTGTEPRRLRNAAVDPTCVVS